MDENSQETQPAQKTGGLPMGVIAAAVVLVVGGVGYYLLTQSSNQQAPVQTETAPTETPSVMEKDESVQQKSTDGAMMEKVKTFNISGKNFEFSEKEIRVKKGDTVKIVFTSSNGFHDWTVDEFNAKTKQINTGETSEIEFVADKAGTFEYYCSVGNHRKMGMVGNLIVE